MNEKPFMMIVQLQFALNVVYLVGKHYQEICDNLTTAMKFGIGAMGQILRAMG